MSSEGQLKRGSISPVPEATSGIEQKSRPRKSGSASKKLHGGLFVYVGTDTEASNIYLYKMDPNNGALEHLDSFNGGANPSFLALSPDGQYLYAVNELSTSEGRPSGAVSAFGIDPQSGRLTFINRQPSHGSAPCHLATDRQGRFLLLANYLSGTLAVYPLSTDGRLGAAFQVVQHQGKGKNPVAQEGPHAHFVTVTADNRFVFSCDLGIDKVLIYRFDSGNGTLLAHGEVLLSPGAGPRHLDFHPTGQYVYVINELDSTMTVLAYAAESGTLTKMQTLSTLPEGYDEPNSCAEVWAHPAGKHVYGSNRGHDSIVIYAVEKGAGHLRLVGHESTRGKIPRSFAIDPTGAFLLVANQASDILVSFRIDPETGRLAYLQQLGVPKPACVMFRAFGQLI